MFKALSLKMDNRIFEETESVLKKIRIPRNAYINQAVEFYNRFQKRLLTKRKLLRDVRLLRRETEVFIKSTELLEDLHE